MMENMSESFLQLLNSVKAKRPKTVIQHILKHGFITSQDLKDTYGYNHPPRAIRDVKEYDIPIESYRVTGADGRSIAAYKFGAYDENSNSLSKKSGRSALSKVLKSVLIEKYGSRCFIYLEKLDVSQLQVDHRVPYEIAGECDEKEIDNFMLLSPSANRAKSWTCEHCENWDRKDKDFCLHCFWAYPENYEHIAGRKEKIINLVFSGDEIEDYDKLIKLAGDKKADEFIKEILKEKL